MSFMGSTVESTANPFDHIVIGVGDDAEQVQRAAAVSIARGIGSAIAVVQEIWDHRDETYYESMPGSTRAKTTIVKPRPENITTGSRPSLIEADREQLPNITVYAGPGRPSRFQGDQFQVNEITIVIEVTVCAGPYNRLNDVAWEEGRVPEETVDRQLLRLASAVHLCFRVDPTLGGIIFPFERPPETRPSLPWVARVDGISGQTYIRKARQSQYVVTTNSI